MSGRYIFQEMSKICKLAGKAGQLAVAWSTPLNGKVIASLEQQLECTDSLRVLILSFHMSLRKPVSPLVTQTYLPQQGLQVVKDIINLKKRPRTTCTRGNNPLQQV